MASPPWVILSREATASADLPQGVALSLALAAPPRVSTVTLHPSVCPVQPDPTARHKSPRVLAADPSAPLFLLLSPPPLSERDDGELRTWRGPDGVERSVRVPTPRFVVCDVSSSVVTASPVPDPDIRIFNNNIGVIAAPGGGGHFMVVVFQHIVGSREATLLCFSSETREWAKKEVVNPQPRCLWTFSDVVAHGGKLWWVDNLAGLLGFDPFADEPPMEHVHLPRALGSLRLVQLCNGVFRCVEMACASRGAPKVSMHSLSDPATSVWTLEYEASFSEIWAGDSYKATGLPEEDPVLALVHPKNPDMVYFFLEGRLFGVDMRAREVMECEPFEPQIYGRFSPYLIFPFELPPVSPHDFIQSLTKKKPTLRSLILPDYDRQRAADIGVRLTHLAGQISVFNNHLTEGADYVNQILPYLEFFVGLLGHGAIGVPSIGAIAVLKQACTVAGRTAAGLAIAERIASAAGFQLQLMRPGAQSGCRAPVVRDIVLVRSVAEAKDIITTWRHTNQVVVAEVSEQMGKEEATEIYNDFVRKGAYELIMHSDVLLSKISDPVDRDWVIA